MKASRVLIIEDEVALAKAIGAVCERIGASPKLCASGTSGLEAFFSEPFQLVVLDLGLPDMSGLAVMAEVKRLSSHSPVLIITAHGTLKNAVSSRQLGAVGYAIQSTTNLAGVWTTLTNNITGNGSLYQFTMPITNVTQIFFRVRQP